MDMGHARALLSLPGSQQSQVAHQVVDRGLSVRDTETLVRRLLERPATRKSAESAMDPDVRELAAKLSDKLGAKVRIQHGSGGKGRLSIEYHSLDELEGILSRIR